MGEHDEPLIPPIPIHFESDELEEEFRDAKEDWLSIFSMALESHLFDMGDITPLNRQAAIRVTRAAAEIADAALEEIERRWGKTV